MPIVRSILMVLAACLFAARFAGARSADVSSPDGQIIMRLFGADAADGDVHYVVDYRGRQLFAPSRLGIEFIGQAQLGPGMHVVGMRTGSLDQTYSIPVGKTRLVRNRCNSVEVDFADAAGRKFTIEVRAFDDGVALRYSVPAQPSIHNVRITREMTEFNFDKDAITYPLILDGFETAYEDEYQQRSLSGLHSDWLIALPYLANVPGVGWVAITEADIEDYAGMYLRKNGDFRDYGVHAELAPHRDAEGAVESGFSVETQAPFSSPWRVLMIANEPGKLIESNIVLNLNPPSNIADTSWIKAGKSAWDWWSGDAAPGVTFKTGMNTATMKHYIDFASASGFPYMLIDAGWALADRKGPFDYAANADITRATPEIDMPELLRYAKERNVKLWLWAHWASVDKYMDRAFPLYEKWGIAGIKIDFMQRDDQWMVNWYRRVAQLAAQHHLMVDFHGAFKPDGLRRTYPNIVTREAVMGQEYSRWGIRTAPGHDTTLPFTRMLAGPMDYTPGAFGNSNLAGFVARRFEPMGLGTRAHELALYVVFESPFQMVSDYPEHYEGQKEFEFLKRVPCNWDEVRAIGGAPMKWVALARRSRIDWYVGSLTNWDARDIKVPLSFLGPGQFDAEIYSDAPDSADQPTHTVRTQRKVDRATILDVHMVSGGGSAMWIRPALNP